MLHPGLKIMPFKLTGYCRLRSKDGNSSQETFMALQRQMESLNKDKCDCRTFQLVKEFVHSWRHLEKWAIIFFLTYLLL